MLFPLQITVVFACGFSAGRFYLGDMMLLYSNVYPMVKIKKSLRNSEAYGYLESIRFFIFWNRVRQKLSVYGDPLHGG